MYVAMYTPRRTPHAVRPTISSAKTTKYALRVANPRAADRLAGGWPPERRIVMTP